MARAASYFHVNSVLAISFALRSAFLLAATCVRQLISEGARFREFAVSPRRPFLILARSVPPRIHDVPRISFRPSLSRKPSSTFPLCARRILNFDALMTSRVSARDSRTRPLGEPLQSLFLASAPDMHFQRSKDSHPSFFVSLRPTAISHR